VAKMVREVVTVDISNFEERKHEIAKQLFEAAKDVGFFYISGK
jgi:isopenicillin N synthase-like dioxygenase